MQARWGTHGDHPIIVLAPASVQEIYDETIRAFNLAEDFRTPVIVLYDEVDRASAGVGRLCRSAARCATLTRKWASGDASAISCPTPRPTTVVPVMARPGDGYRVHVTGLTHTRRTASRPRSRTSRRRRRSAFSTRSSAIATRIDRIEALDMRGRRGRHRRRRHRRARRAPRRRRSCAAPASGPGCSARSRCGRSPRRRCARRRRERAPRARSGDERRPARARSRADRSARDKVARLNRIDGEPIAPADIARQESGSSPP